jgi:chromosome segregation ATPase
MNKYSKPLAVFIAAAAFTFLGFAAVSSVGGTNWNAESEQLSPAYTIESVPGDKITWKATDNVTGKAVNPSKPEVQASAVIAARRDLDKKQKEEIGKLNAATAEANGKRETAEKLRTLDTEALKKRAEELQTKLAEVNKQILDIRGESIRKAQESQAIRAEAERRRGDVYRLERELAEIEADLYQATEHQKFLRDHLERLNGMIGPLERRHEQLEASK